MKVAALVVSYFPDDELPDRLDALMSQVDRLVIVDNGSDEATLRTLEGYAARNDVTVYANGANLGIAAALNRGLTILADEGFEWVLTMDQDSLLAPGAVVDLAGQAADDVALIGANRDDSGTDQRHRWLRSKRGFPGFERVTCDRIDGRGVTLVITSGTLTSIRAFKAVGPFREDFFIDFVDFEYCLRARRAGYRIAVSCGAVIRHHVGSKAATQAVGVTLAPTHHSALRRYYLFRNGVVTMREFARTQPHWLVYQLLAFVEVLVGIAVAEDDKAAKLKACALGAWAGLRNQLGPAQREFVTR